MATGPSVLLLLLPPPMRAARLASPAAAAGWGCSSSPGDAAAADDDDVATVSLARSAELVPTTLPRPRLCISAHSSKKHKQGMQQAA